MLQLWRKACKRIERCLVLVIIAALPKGLTINWIFTRLTGSVTEEIVAVLQYFDYLDLRKLCRFNFNDFLPPHRCLQVEALTTCSEPFLCNYYTHTHTHTHIIVQTTPSCVAYIGRLLLSPCVPIQQLSEHHSSFHTNNGEFWKNHNLCTYFQ